MICELYNADCLDIMREMPDKSVDLIFTDPPFNVSKKYGGDTTKDSRADYYDWCDDWIEEGFRILKDTGTFYLMTISRHLEYKFPMMKKRGIFINLINWHNVSAVNDKRRFWCSTQPILVYGKTPDYIFNPHGEPRRILKENHSFERKSVSATNGQFLDYWDDIPFVYAGAIHHKEAILKEGTNSKLHPAQMPVGLPERAIRFSTFEGGIIFDPFMGSGSSGVASIRTGRDFIGIEKDLTFFEAGKARIEKRNETGQAQDMGVS